jgi:hypothetical protein
LDRGAELLPTEVWQVSKSMIPVRLVITPPAGTSAGKLDVVVSERSSKRTTTAEFIFGDERDSISSI